MTPVVPGVQPPYLLDQYAPGQGDGVSVCLDVGASTAVLGVHGAWGRGLLRTTDTAMHKCLSEHPAALILDLTALADSHATSAPMWMTARRLGAAMDPAVQVLACVPEDSRLTQRLYRLGVVRSLPIFPTVAQACTAAAQRLPLTGRMQLDLAPDAHAATRARNLVSDICVAWRVPDLRDRARLVISELVNNAVQHAGTPITVLLSRRGDGVHLAVCDGDPGLPRLLTRDPMTPDTLSRRGLGLRAVHAAATVWGAMPTRHGKVVWATIRGCSRRE
ncbi:ATP-binding protein [Actinoplanes sp. GCM10030250]|uniref:ATP-binding protein n=1 Tax=Actinoplanes sp. GCM10030250 TaxID=3273376 RepID=UPI0036111C84